MDHLLETYREILIANELGGDPLLAYRFSDADGVRTGKSGYSFGICQFDLAHNTHASQCLLDCGIDKTSIAGLIQQTLPEAEVIRLSAVLAACAWVVNAWDTAEMRRTLGYVKSILKGNDLVVADDESFLHLCDYHNQFHLDPRGKCMSYLMGLRPVRPITRADLVAYKLAHTAWGRKRPDDVERRYRNIVKLCGKATA